MTHSNHHILLVGKFSTDPTVYTYPSSFIESFEAASCRVTTFNLADAARPIREKISKRLPYWGQGLSAILLNKALIITARQIIPTIIFIIKGASITAATLKQIKTTLPSTIIVHFYPDNPFCFWNGNSNANVLAGLPHTDLFLIWSKELIPVLLSAGCQRVDYFPFAVDEKIYHPRITLSCEETPIYTSDVVFVGTWDREREFFLSHIAKQLPTINLAIWGNRWKEQLKNDSPLMPLIRGNALYKNNLLKAFSGAKIVLNFIRIQNLQAHNMRTFEALAAGSFLLTQKTTEQCDAPFIQDVNIACFNDAEDLIKKIAFYVNQDRLRKDVASQGHKLVRNFTLNVWVSSLLDILTRAKNIGRNEGQAKDRHSIHP